MSESGVPRGGGERRYEFELDPVSFITIDTQGPPGGRTFYLQAAQARQVVSLVIEKEHALALALSLEQLLAGLEPDAAGAADEDEPQAATMALLEPVEADFRVTRMGIGVDDERGMIILVAHEREEDDDDAGRTARFVGSYRQMRVLSRHALEVVRQGRPICELCGEPMDPDGHFCPRRNGHHTVAET